MGAITSFDQITNTLTGGTADSESMYVWQDNRIGSAAAPAAITGRQFSLWAMNNSWGGGGAAPGATARNCTRTTQGALGQANPSGGRQLYLASLYANSTTAGTYQWFDRLMDISGRNATTAGTVSGLAMAPARGVGSVAEALKNVIIIEIYTLIGVTGTTLSVDYKDANGVARTSPLIVFGGGNNREQYRHIVVPFATGGRGVTEVTGYTLTATTGTAGDFGITIARPYPSVPIVVGGQGCFTNLVTQQPTFPEILTDACLYCVITAGAATFGQQDYVLSFIEA